MNDLNLMDIAREANKRGDADTLRDALSLLERLLPIVSGRIETFMEFCTELDNAKARPKSVHFGGDDVGVVLTVPIRLTASSSKQINRCAPFAAIKSAA